MYITVIFSVIVFQDIGYGNGCKYLTEVLASREIQSASLCVCVLHMSFKLCNALACVRAFRNRLHAHSFRRIHSTGNGEYMRFLLRWSINIYYSLFFLHTYWFLNGICDFIFATVFSNFVAFFIQILLVSWCDFFYIVLR